MLDFWSAFLLGINGTWQDALSGDGVAILLIVVFTIVLPTICLYSVWMQLSITTKRHLIRWTWSTLRASFFLGKSPAMLVMLLTFWLFGVTLLGLVLIWGLSTIFLGAAMRETGCTLPGWWDIAFTLRQIKISLQHHWHERHS